VGVVGRLEPAALERAAREWAERTCEEQGLPVKVRDPAVLREIVALLVSGREGATASKPGRAGKGRTG